MVNIREGTSGGGLGKTVVVESKFVEEHDGAGLAFYAFRLHFAHSFSIWYQPQWAQFGPQTRPPFWLVLRPNSPSTATRGGGLRKFRQPIEGSLAPYSLPFGFCKLFPPASIVSASPKMRLHGELFTDVILCCKSKF